MPNQQEHQYDLRRFPSKFNGRCRGCGADYAEGDTVLWGKPGGKSATYHDNAACVPRSLTFDETGGSQVPRSHTETPAERVAEAFDGRQVDNNSGGAGHGGHAAHDPNADTMAGTRLLLDKLIGIEQELQTVRAMVVDMGAKLVQLSEKLDGAPF